MYTHTLCRRGHGWTHPLADALTLCKQLTSPQDQSALKTSSHFKTSPHNDRAVPALATSTISFVLKRDAFAPFTRTVHPRVRGRRRQVVKDGKRRTSHDQSIGRSIGDPFPWHTVSQ